MGKKNKSGKFKIREPAHIKLDTALRTTNERGCILRQDILSTLMPDRVVRISMHVSKNSPYDCQLDRDSPYVKILEVKDTRFLGKILNEFRAAPEHYYPLRSGENIWFGRQNIIEIPYLSADEEQKFTTAEYVAHTGPLETIDLDDQSDTDSESDADSTASEEDNHRVVADLRGKHPLTPIPRGRQFN